jgi:hypothetical protein
MSGIDDEWNGTAPDFPIQEDVGGHGLNNLHWNINSFACAGEETLF